MTRICRARTHMTLAAMMVFAPVGALADSSTGAMPVNIEMFSPERGHRVGIDGKGWFVDLEIEFPVPLAQSGFTLNGAGEPGFQVTGPDGHNNIEPMPGVFAVGADERIPGLIVLLTTTTVAEGSCQNLANLFNITGVTDLSPNETELWDTWIIGAPNFGVGTESTIFVAVADDLNGDGIFNDAPDVVADVDGNGICNVVDLKALGVASNIERTRFFINGPVDLTEIPLVP